MTQQQDFAAMRADWDRAMTNTQNKPAPAAPAASQEAAPNAWQRAEALANQPAIHEAIVALLDDNTGDNATALIAAVLRAQQAAQPPQSSRFRVSEDGRYIDDTQREHDAAIMLCGHYSSDEERLAYASEICALMNAQPPQAVEPVAWRYAPSDAWRDYVLTDNPTKAELARQYGREVQPLYTAAPAAQPLARLTDEQIVDEFCRTPGIHQFVSAFVAGARFAERAITDANGMTLGEV